jgi:hypothetical protein
MSRASPKKSVRKSPEKQQSIVVQTGISTIVRTSYEYEFKERLNTVEVENV